MLQFSHMKESKCAIFLADGFETCEGLIVIDLLRRAGITIDMISMNDTLSVTTSQNVVLNADKLYKDVNVSDYDVLILPGGKVGTKNLETCESLKKSLKEHFESGKLTCAICAAPSIFGHLGMLQGKNYTCFPDFDDAYGGTYQQELAVTDGNLITARGMGATLEFAREILKQLIDEEGMKKVQHGIQYEHTFRNE
jgi:protein deglycase